ncbi:recombinase family protein [Lysobacter sp. CAU 1642]|uniref:Recombinase family protein n=2 Tax=Pseudomarimonas salicorniae TaxID=2933270 RepID=A0ABT0GG52_9GAMM|nr:recombinase family protein [Lysobacter sp. CAU 1642]
MSTPDQLKGDSARRQLAESQAYVEKRGLELVESMADLGISAFRGRNREEGRLRWFLEKLEEGEIEAGSFLVIESMDRLSRQNVPAVAQLFFDIIDKGVTIVTLDDRQEYSKESLVVQGYQLHVALGAMSRAHEESRRKSQMIAAVWAEKKKKARDMTVATRRIPAWLRVNDQGAIEPIPERAALVRRVFELSAGGFGSYSIARLINEEQIPTWGPKRKSGAPPVWRESYIKKIIFGRTVLGEYQPHLIKDGLYSQRDRVADGEPIKGYYPAIVDEELYARAHVAIASRRNNGAGRKGRTYSNLFTGLLRCGHCGGGYRYINKGEGSKGGQYLHCSVASAKGKCHARAFQYGYFEQALLNLFLALDVDRVLQRTPRNQRLRKLRNRRDALAEEISNLKQSITNLQSVIEQAGSELDSSFVSRATALSLEVATKNSEMEAVQKEISSMQRVDPAEHRKRVSELLAEIGKAAHQEQTEVYRRALAAELRRSIRIIVISMPTHVAHELQCDYADWKKRFGVRSTVGLERLIHRVGYRVKIHHNDDQVEEVDMLTDESIRLKWSRKFKDLRIINALPE